jgi:hypothetical protein
MINQHWTRFMGISLTYQDRSAALETCVLPVDSHRRHVTFPETLLVDIGKTGQCVGVEFRLV